MKLYIIPLQTACNANCLFCITKYKKEIGFGGKLEVDGLKKKIEGLEIDKIEITGGGEPLLHPEIEKIIEVSAKKAPTQIYTNGALVFRLKSKTVKQLSRLCLSRSHYSDEINEIIMGVKYDLKALKRIGKLIPIKLSVVACRSGISDLKELEKYIAWGKKELGAREVVVRQMFDFDYPAKITKEVIKVSPLLREAKKKYQIDGQVNDNQVLKIKGVRVEFEEEVCACQMGNLVLRPNGVIYQGWEKQKYEEK